MSNGRGQVTQRKSNESITREEILNELYLLGQSIVKKGGKLDEKDMKRLSELSKKLLSLNPEIRKELGLDKLNEIKELDKEKK
jgi:hypothetical protein